MNRLFCLSGVAFVLLMNACSNEVSNRTVTDTTVAKATGDTFTQPYATKSVRRFSHVIGWTEDKKPVAPEGFLVEKFAGDLKNPRWIYVLPNGDVLIAEASSVINIKKKAGALISSQNTEYSANRITLLRDKDHDGQPEVRELFLENLNQPLGMLLLGNTFYVANTDGLYTFPYKKDDTKITGAGTKIMDLPAGGYNNHWTRNIVANAAGTKIYISVGSGSNVGENGMEKEENRANILEINPDGSGQRVYASGIRNPVGMDWAPGTHTLWTSVNERDELGDELVPDYLTSVKEEGFYGWPWAYWGSHEDPRLAGQNTEMVKKSIVPEVALGSHTASLGLAFYTGKAFPQAYHQAAFIGQHGSWNRSVLAGYKIVYVPFSNGKPTGTPKDFLTGFMSDKNNGDVYGRPAGVAVLPDGSLLVADDAGNTIWRVSVKK